MKFKGIGCCSLVQCNKNWDKFVGLSCAKARGIILPGGKWKEEETFKEAAARELFEEAGLVATSQQLIFHGMNSDGFYGYTFLTEVEDCFVGHETEEGNTVWATKKDFMDSIFAPYYELMFERIGL